MAERATDDEPIRMGGMALSINPGSGAVLDSTDAEAIANIQHFILDLQLDREIHWLREPRHDERGRYTFLLYPQQWITPRPCTLVDMPGRPLDRVRWRQGLDPWLFPRLYVDGSSWLWGFALSSARRALSPEGEDEE